MTGSKDRVYFIGLLLLSAVLSPPGLWPQLGVACSAILETVRFLVPRSSFRDSAECLLVITMSTLLAALNTLAARRFLSRDRASATAGELTAFGAVSVVLAVANAAVVGLVIFLWVNND
jgi:hypothetical protein